MIFTPLLDECNYRRIHGTDYGISKNIAYDIFQDISRRYGLGESLEDTSPDVINSILEHWILIGEKNNDSHDI